MWIFLSAKANNKIISNHAVISYFLLVFVILPDKKSDKQHLLYDMVRTVGCCYNNASGPLGRMDRAFQTISGIRGDGRE